MAQGIGRAFSNALPFFFSWFDAYLFAATILQLGLPVLIHQSDPVGFFEPVTPDNEHYTTMLRYPDWSFLDPRYSRKRELLERRDRLIARHPRTTFILPHVANWPENLGYVSDLLDRFPNV